VDVVVDAEHSMVTASIAAREATGRVNAEATQRIDKVTMTPTLMAKKKSPK
jgi:hypothetical protein